MRIPLAFALALLLTLAATGLVLAHEHWIGQGSYKNARGQSCCNAVDCTELADDTLREVKTGYLYLPTGEVVTDWMWSEDEFAHACFYNRSDLELTLRPIRCLFVPPFTM